MNESSRVPAVAGRFYPADEFGCRRSVESLFAAAKPGRNDGTRWLGGIVPHAGWVFSGAIAADTLLTLAQSGKPDVVVVFGAIHTPMATNVAVLDAHSQWQTPGEEFEVAEHLQSKLVEMGGLFAVDGRFHEHEHAVEVELPLIGAVWPDAMILPVEVPAIDGAVEMGLATGKQVIQAGLNAMYLASSDLTHYGPSYGFTPSGIGPAGLRWAMDNDRRLLQCVTDMQAEQVVREARSRRNACGGGAIAAMMAACREHGATRSMLLRHTSSSEVLENVRGSAPTDAVGYASVVVA